MSPVPATIATPLAGTVVRPPVATPDAGARLVTRDVGTQVLAQDVGARLVASDVGTQVLAQDVGARLVTRDVGTPVAAVVGAALLVIVGLRLAYLAVRTRGLVAPTQATLWEYYGLAGVVATLVGALRLAALWIGLAFPSLDGLVLAFALLLALAIREAYYNATLSNAEPDRVGEYRLRRTVEFGLVGAVVLGAVAPVVRPTLPVAHLVAATALAIATYGCYFQVRRTHSGAARGTLVDSLTRQTVLALAFVTAALAAPALVIGPVARPVAAALSEVLLVAAAASALAITVKLGQHLSGQT